MKIAWFSPLSEESGISRYTIILTEKLSNYCDIDLWTSEQEITLPLSLQIIPYNPDNPEVLNQLKNYDFIVYNMGNNIKFHKDIYEISKKVQGIVILHDIVMHHFFASYFLAAGNRDLYLRVMYELYGNKGQEVAYSSVSGRTTPVWETPAVIQYPLFELALKNAEAVITHSNFAKALISKRFQLPIESIYYPYYPHDLKQTDLLSRKELNIPEDKILMLTVGHVNPNKKIDFVIETLGKYKNLFNNVLYYVIGSNKHPLYSSRLNSLIEKYKLHNTVKFIDFQPHKIFYSFMKNADIFINLRYPNTEAASASLIEQLYLGKPVVVLNSGFFSELPEEVVVKTSLNVNDLYQKIRLLVEQKELRITISKRAKEFARRVFNIDQYSEKFFSFLDEVNYIRTVGKFVDNVSNELTRMKIQPDSGLVEKLSDEIFKLISPVKG